MLRASDQHYNHGTLRSCGLLEAGVEAEESWKRSCGPEADPGRMHCKSIVAFALLHFAKIFQANLGHLETARSRGEQEHWLRSLAAFVSAAALPS